MNNIANNIRDLRKEKGLSQEQMAELLHVTRQTVSAWERGVAQPGLDTLGEIAKALEIEPEQLLYGKEAGPKKPVYHTVTLWPVLGVVPLYLAATLFLLAMPMTAWLGGRDVTFALCGQIFLAMEIAFCYCALKDLIRNREYYDKLEDEEEKP